MESRKQILLWYYYFYYILYYLLSPKHFFFGDWMGFLNNTLLNDLLFIIALECYHSEERNLRYNMCIYVHTYIVGMKNKIMKNRLKYQHIVKIELVPLKIDFFTNILMQDTNSDEKKNTKYQIFFFFYFVNFISKLIILFWFFKRQIIFIQIYDLLDKLCIT